MSKNKCLFLTEDGLCSQTKPDFLKCNPNAEEMPCNRYKQANREITSPLPRKVNRNPKMVRK